MITILIVFSNPFGSSRSIEKPPSPILLSVLDLALASYDYRFLN
jgi:hypothetical protein